MCPAPRRLANSGSSSRVFSFPAIPLSAARFFLQAVADGISEYYHQRGYLLAKAILPEQEIVDGAITLHIFEGRIGKIVIQGNESYSPDFLQAYFNGMKKEGVFRKQAMEHALIMMNDLPGMTVSSMLQAGEEAGTTDLIVTVKEGKQFKTDLTVDNFGSQYARVRAKSGWHCPRENAHA